MKEKTDEIEILEDYIEALRKPKPFKYTNEQKAKAIENFISENKELKEMVETFRKENVEAMIQKRQYELHYIPKSKVEEILDKYKYTEIEEGEKIIQFYKELQSLLGKE